MGRIDAKVTFKLQGVPGYESSRPGSSGPFRYRKDAVAARLRPRDRRARLRRRADLGRRAVVRQPRDDGLRAAGRRAPPARALGGEGAQRADAHARAVRHRAVALGDRRASPPAPGGWTASRSGTSRPAPTSVASCATRTRCSGFMRSLGITRAIGLPDEIGPAARRVIVRSVTTFAAGSWVGTKDKVLRRSRLRHDFVVPKARAGRGRRDHPRRASSAQLNVTQVGRRQRIAAPATIGPFADFAVGLDALGDAQDAGADRPSDPRRRSSWSGGHRLRRLRAARSRDAAGRAAALAAPLGARSAAEGHAAEVRRRRRAARPADRRRPARAPAARPPRGAARSRRWRPATSRRSSSRCARSRAARCAGAG